MACSLALGTFDGVHTAHQALISRAASLSDRIIACTFPLPPAVYFNKAQFALSLSEEKERLLLRYGVTEVYVQDFASVCALSPEEYIGLLCEKFKPAYIVAGFNHRFGKNAEGSFKTLSRLSGKYGFSAEMVLPVKNGGETVSSTLIRRLLSEGETEKAAVLLGRSYSLTGLVVHGRHLGSTLDFPTANIEIAPFKLAPPGVYASFAYVNNRTVKAITNVGVNPTVGANNKKTVEAHLMGFSGDLYGKSVTVTLEKKLRDERKFDSLEQLRHQLALDAVTADAYLQYKIK